MHPLRSHCTLDFNQSRKSDLRGLWALDEMQGADEDTDGAVLIVLITGSRLLRFVLFLIALV